MADDYQDYFKSEEHAAATARDIESERALLEKIATEEGAFAAVSRLVAILAAYPTFLKAIGLKKVAVTLLQDALKEARKGAQ